MKRLTLALATVLLALPAHPRDVVEPAAYLDDRSTATAVVRSLYNAIDRREYLRAWSYFRESERPRLEDFIEGYADTESVQLKTGEEMAEGAAGTTWWTVPVAIETLHTDGTTEVFAGCYTLAQPNPAIQATPPFEPISIRDGSLHAADAPLEDAVPADC